MDLKQIERLMTAMGRAGMKRVVLKQEGFEIELERECMVRKPLENILEPTELTFEKAPPLEEMRFQETSTISRESPKREEGRYIVSPMVGTFYLSPAPKDPAFVKPGDDVDEDKVVCIIEAMKVMNEVKAGARGKIAEILVKNGEPVEFGTKLFRII